MIKYFAKAFKITNENIILTTPLVLFLFLLSLYMGVAQNAPENLASATLLLITILFMVSAFFAGWFHMVKKAVALDKQEFIIEEDKARASFGLIKEIPVGIGEYFLPFIGALILYAVFFVLLVIIGYEIGIRLIGNAGVSLEQIRNALASPATMKGLITSLSAEQLKKLNAWNFLFLVGTGIFSFLTMFWAVEIVSRTKNPFIAFFRSIKFEFSNLLSALILFTYISVVNFSVSLINAFSMIHPIVYFISMLVYFYFVVYVVVLVFLYYDREKDKQNDKQLETQEGFIQDRDIQGDGPKGDCNNGTDSLGQDETGDKTGEDE